jgi:hypothetical protein
MIVSHPPPKASGIRSIEYFRLLMYMMGTPGICSTGKGLLGRRCTQETSPPTVLQRTNRKGLMYAPSGAAS